MSNQDSKQTVIEIVDKLDYLLRKIQDFNSQLKRRITKKTIA